jgi:glucose dehydrogenase
MTFLGKKTGRQFVVIAAGGSGLLSTADKPEPASDTLDAFALPDK